MKHRFILLGTLTASWGICGCSSLDNGAPSGNGLPDATTDAAADAASGVESGIDASVPDGPTTDGQAPDAAGPDAAGDDSGDDSGDGSTGPICLNGTASMVCPSCAAPQVCCAQKCVPGQSGVFTSCGDTTCGGMGGALLCLGPQDCDGGICCGSGANSAPLDTSCVAGTTCPNSRQLIVCRTVADCPAPVNFRCSSGSSTAGIYSTCRGAPPAMDAGAVEDGAADGAPPADGGDGGDDGGGGGEAGDAAAD